MRKPGQVRQLWEGGGSGRWRKWKAGVLGCCRWIGGGTRTLGGGHKDAAGRDKDAAGCGTRRLWGNKDAAGRKNKETTRACPGLRDRNVACAERSGKAGGQPERLWGPDRRAATLGAGGNGARVPGHRHSGAGDRGCCRPLWPAQRNPQPHPEPTARGHGSREQPVSIRGEGCGPCGVTLGSPPSRPQDRGSGPQLPGRGGTRRRRRSGRVSRSLHPAPGPAPLSLATRSLCFSISETGTPPPGPACDVGGQ